MTRMTLKAVHVDGDPRRVPLSERIVDENLGSYHHVPRPRERLRAATADAGSARRDQPSLLRIIITTIMLGMLTRVIRRRGARDVAPAMMSTTKRSWTWRGHTRGLTRICVSAGASLAARLIAPRKAAWAPPGVQPAR